MTREGALRALADELMARVLREAMRMQRRCLCGCGVWFKATRADHFYIDATHWRRAHYLPGVVRRTLRRSPRPRLRVVRRSA